MKKIKFDKKLSLNKETIAKLNDAQMKHVKGGEVEINSKGCATNVKSCINRCWSLFNC